MLNTMFDDSAPVLAHIHLPKTAGSSLSKVLDAVFHSGQHQQLYFDNCTEFVYSNAELKRLVEPASVCAFSSHFVRRFPPVLGRKQIYYITVLREPVQQFISYITYTKKHFAYIKDPVLLSHLPSEMAKRSTRECARWILSGDPARLRNFSENYTTNFFARYTVLDRAGYRYNDPRYRAIRLEMAKEVLENFLCVGISEEMDETWQSLRMNASRVGILLPNMQLPHENVSSDLRDDLSWIHWDDPIGRALLSSVAVDQQLYQWARVRFRTQLQRSLAA